MKAGVNRVVLSINKKSRNKVVNVEKRVGASTDPGVRQHWFDEKRTIDYPNHRHASDR